MKYFALVALFSLIPAALGVAADAEFDKRACTASKCICILGNDDGLFCGDQSINPDCINGHVYQCNAAGFTCDFGVRTSCVQCGELQC